MESIVVLLLLGLVRRNAARIVIAIAYGVVIVTGLVLAAINAGYESVLDMPFDPLDSQQLVDAFGVVQGSIGSAAAHGLLAVLAVVVAGSVVLLSWAALRAGAAFASERRNGAMVLSTLAAAWTIAALTGSQFAAGQPAAAAASLDAITASVSRSAAGLAASADLSHRIATDPYRDARGSDLLGALKGKDVVFAFIESYGRVAVQGSDLSDDVDRVLLDGERRLQADHYASRSAFLTSSTFGGLSWLAHSTFQTGLWVDRQPLYTKVVRSDRLTLSDAFGRAGWRTVSDVPSNVEPWSFGTTFYHFDTLLDANDVGYRGPRFGYARIPDQYTWKHFADGELRGEHAPVMAEIDLVSSHTPWAPLPQLVPWSQVGDGSVFRSQPEQGRSATEVWQDPDQVRQAYSESIRYSLDAMFGFLHEVDDPNLVLVVLGDHQPAPIVSGSDADHDVPISIISKDPAVFAAIDGWNWQDGMLPAPDAPVWPMSAFRDRFLDAYSAG